MRRFTTLVLVLGVVALEAAPASAGTTVQLTNYVFTPKSITVAEGTTVTWHNNTSATNHTSTGDGPLSLWDTGTIAAGASDTFSFSWAGSYPYHCMFHVSLGMVGTVRISLPVSPSSGSTSTTFTVTLRSAALPSGSYAMDVQKKRNSGTWNLWRTGLTGTMTTFDPNRNGTYHFRSRLHRTSDDATSKYSPQTTVTVS